LIVHVASVDGQPAAEPDMRARRAIRPGVEKLLTCFASSTSDRERPERRDVRQLLEQVRVDGRELQLAFFSVRVHTSWR
jgi:hypothetical protein